MDSPDDLTISSGKLAGFVLDFIDATGQHSGFMHLVIVFFVLLAFWRIIAFGFYSYYFFREKWTLRLSEDGILCVDSFEKWENLLYIGGRKSLLGQKVRLEYFYIGNYNTPVTVWFLHKLSSSDCQVIEDFLNFHIPQKKIAWQTFYIFRPYPWISWITERRHTMPDVPYDPLKGILKKFRNKKDRSK